MAESGDYWNALDRRGVLNPEKLDVDPTRIGISHGIGDVGEGLKANVFRGASAVELGFMGRGKGYRSQPTGATPESFGSVEREDIRQLARINEVELSTHAAPDLGRPSGITDDQSAFNPVVRENALHEMQRAIDFAADTAQGGPVVIHLGEFPRALFEVDEQFQAHPEEAKKAPLFLVDERTGQIQSLRRDMRLSVPAMDKKDPSKYKRDEHGLVQFKEVTFEELAKEDAEKAAKEGREPNPAKYFYDTYFQKQLELQRAEQGRWTGYAREEAKKLRDLQAIEAAYERAVEKGKDEDFARHILWNGMKERQLLPQSLLTGKGLPQSEDVKQYIEHPEEYLKEQIRQYGKVVENYEDHALSAGRSAHELEVQLKNLKPIEDYGVTNSATTIARAAMDAYAQEQRKKLKKPLYISPENWNPESYGNHPKEYKKIIKESRKEMERLLLEQKKASNREEAKKIAAEHIKGTFDVGHLNFWRKYFKGSDKEFKKWVDKQAKDLAKEGVIGNVHLSDNFGYHDEHLTPGEGNAPIQRFVKRLEEKGYTGRYIGEVGGQKEGFYHQSWTGTLKSLHSPVYRIDDGAHTWSDIEHSYFGRVPQSPYFLVGDVAPSKDWSLWSETPLE